MSSSGVRKQAFAEATQEVPRMLNESLLPVVLVVQFSERLANLRKRHGLTQKALAVTAGVHLSQYRRYSASRFG